jgi:membrane-associated phospholipid phosphatase
MQLFPSRAPYIVVFAVLLIDVLWIARAGHSVPLGQVLWSGLAVAFFALGAFASGYAAGSTRGDLFLRCSHFLKGLAFLQLAWIAIRLLNHLTMTTSFAYADTILSAGDKMIGFDWMAYYQFVQARPLLIKLLDVSYTSLGSLCFLTFLVLVLLNEPKRTAFFLETFFATALICTATGFLLPAQAAVVHYIGANAIFENFTQPPGLYHLKHLEQLRSGTAITFSLSALPGLVTFPSFHTAAGIILAATFRGSPLFAVATIYSAVMISSTPVFGGHYLVDIIAGSLVALAVVKIATSSSRYRGLFELTGRPLASPQSGAVAA